jgi:hypothetical protein
LLRSRDLWKSWSILRRGIRRRITVHCVGGHDLFLVTPPVLQNADRSHGHDSGSDDSPTKNGPAEPGNSAGRRGQGKGFSCGQSEHDDIAAIATVDQVLDYAVSLAADENMLGERGEEIGIGMRLRGR